MMWLLLLCAAASPSPSPEPIDVKVSSAKAVLYESPETLQECRAATAHVEGLERMAKKLDEDLERAREEYKPPTKPVDAMTPDEVRARKAARAKLDLAFDKLQANASELPIAREIADDACGDAAFAVLSKGTLLTVIRRQGELLHVRVEAGRSTGKAGWIWKNDVTAASPAPEQ